MQPRALANVSPVLIFVLCVASLSLLFLTYHYPLIGSLGIFSGIACWVGMTFAERMMIQKTSDLVASKNLRIMSLAIELENAVDIAEAVLHNGEAGISKKILSDFVTRAKKMLDSDDTVLRSVKLDR